MMQSLSVLFDIRMLQYHVTMTSLSASFPREILLDSEKKIAVSILLGYAQVYGEKY
jgi:hypothetical protein